MHWTITGYNVSKGYFYILQEKSSCSIDNISEIHGSPLPGRMPNHRNSDIVLLPSDFSKHFVYRKYVEASEKIDRFYFSRRKFEELWLDLRPNYRSLLKPTI